MDVLTFHRKGQTSFNDIVNETTILIQTIHAKFPNLREMPYANSEADPTSGWSKSYPVYADVRYAVILILTVLQHWQASYTKVLQSLESISHDNAFLSYHPFEFQQRTLMARFSMNLTDPPHVQFIKKPVYAAMGMLASLGAYASDVRTSDNMTCLTSISENYAGIICTSSDFQDSVETRPYIIRINVSEVLPGISDGNDGAYFMEYLRAKVTDPFEVWNAWDKPAYPNRTVMQEMRKAEVSSNSYRSASIITIIRLIIIATNNLFLTTGPSCAF